jgi:L-fuconolactonase
VVQEILDAQVHAAPEGTPCNHPTIPHATGEQTITAMDYAEVDAALLVVPRGSVWDNSYCLDLATKVPQRFRVVGRMNYESPTVGEEIEEFARHPMSVGLRVVALDDKMAQDMADGGFDRYLSAATKNGLVVCLTGSPYLDILEATVRKFPDTQFVMDHFGVGGYIPGTNTWERVAMEERLPVVLKMASYPNLAAKLTAGPSLSKTTYPFDDVRPVVERFIEEYGVERCMWGTDWTRVTNASYRSGTDYLRFADWLSDDVKDTVFSGTARQVFGWPR